VESPKSSSVGGLLAFLILLVLGGGGIALYHGADDSGWIPRTRDVEMYMGSDWLQGETRVCQAIQARKSDTYEINAIFCPGEIRGVPGHHIPIRFWGRVSRPEILDVPMGEARSSRWRCSRKSDDFTCYAID